MRRTDVILLKPTAQQEKVLHNLAEHSALLWNQANYERRQAYFNRRKIPSYSKQCKDLKHAEHFKALGTGKSQALLKKLNEAWSSYFALKRLEAKGQLPAHLQGKVKPPKYWKDRKTNKPIAKMFCVRSDCYRINTNDSTIILKKGFEVRYASDRIRNGKYGRLDVIYDSVSNRWYAHIPVDYPHVVNQPTVKRYGSIDLGICNLVTLYVENEQPIIYSGRAVLSDWIYWTKKIADLQSQLSEKQHTSLQIQKLFRTRQRRFRHAVNAMLRDMFTRCRAMNITDLVVGDLTGIREDNNIGKNNQKLHNFWSFALQMKRIRELTEEFGIELHEVSERNTSKTCCMCGKQYNGRVHRGLHVCKEKHMSINADVSGACNILKKVAVNRTLGSAHTDIESSGSRLMAQPLMLRWEYHQWH